MSKTYERGNYIVYYRVDGEVGQLPSLAKKYGFSQAAALVAVKDGRNKVKGHTIEKIGKAGAMRFNVISDGKVEFTGTAEEVAEEYLISAATVYKASKYGWLVQDTWRIVREGYTND